MIRDEIDKFTLAFLGWHQELYVSIVNAFIYMSSLAQMKFGLSKVIPYLFVRADEPEIVAECIRQYDQTPPGEAHRVSDHFAGEESGYRGLLEECANSGECPPALKGEVYAYSMLKPEYARKTSRAYIDAQGRRRCERRLRWSLGMVPLTVWPRIWRRFSQRWMNRRVKTW